MATIEDQLALEQEMVARGIENFNRETERAEEKSRGAETGYARRLMHEMLSPLMEALTEFVEDTKPGVGGKARVLLNRCGVEAAAFIALKTLFNYFTLDTPLAWLATTIGKQIEDEVRFSRFEEMHGDYYKQIKEDFKRKGTKDYRYQHRVLTHAANKHFDQWINWSTQERALVGMKLIDMIITHTDLVEKREFKRNGRTHVSIVPTQEATQWINDYKEAAALLFPDRMPCIIEPDDWTELNQGGYYSPEVRNITPFVKTSNPRHLRVLGGADLSSVMDAVNHLQHVRWQVNREVLDVLKAVWANNLAIGIPAKEPLEVPPSPFVGRDKETLDEAELERLQDWKHEAAEVYTAEKERVGKAFQVSRIIRLAEKYAAFADVWYVWYCDFRGRLYTATAGFSPQGPDFAKGCLRFSEGKELGERGWYWLRVHGANRYGFDKGTYDERVQWVNDRRDEFLRAAEDPLSYRSVWADADKPYQFLAFLLEYRAAIIGGDPERFVSKLPVGLDGSCNGLQNFSAMLRDEVGGRATNLVPSDRPSDIYAEVAAVCTKKLMQIEDAEYSYGWRAFLDKNCNGVIPRSLSKRPVMTLPYGSTRQSCTQYVYSSILDIDRDSFPSNFSAAVWLTPHLWESIGEVVVAAREAMTWLQACAKAMNKADKPLAWTTNDGFVAYQGSRQVESVQIETQLAGRFRLRVGRITNKLDKAKQRNGIAPSFVHSQDAAHLRETVRRAKAAGLTSISTIHDDYGTHAADTDVLHKVIREAFVSMYMDRCPLEEFKDAHEKRGVKLPPVPEKGTLHIEDVLRSPYFFG
ncbi:DNA-directed RNA polymerase [Pannonibacter sp. SL95]|uniref:DNA-directed RNA polymerase n=1 Tax=Pannonibacter sp. SL95 TaxID=2995153 RepID=UPI002272322F|nr:DNA-directed RNA polymerase [Pannonibacter sp. SL95]MCY1708368.1 hypothetical protein [Pannonibacter sp. SL95]